MTEIPEVHQLSGNGDFSSEEATFNADFILTQYPEKIDIATQFDTVESLSSTQDIWMLKGFLDDGRPIICDKLLLTQTAFFRFTPSKSLEIGTHLDAPIHSAVFPLLGFFEGGFALQDADWSIKVVPDQRDLKILKNTSKAWGIPEEGLNLQISHPDATPEQYLEKALDLMPLLSLPSGVNVAFNRQILSWETENTVEIWGKGTGGCLGLNSMLLSNWYQHYLEKALPIWNALSADEQKLIRVAILYLNASAQGYMEDKILNVHIAWEMLADAWTKGEARSREIDALKTKLMQAYKEWRVENPQFEDQDGFLKGRISESLKWDRAIKKIRQLAREYDIDDRRIGIDFRRLKKLRDSVAHRGLMPREAYLAENELPPYKLLLSTQFGLRILLLKKLDYTGQVASAKDNWRTFVDIEDADFEA